MVKQFWKWLFTILGICSFKKGLLGYVSWNRIETTKKIEIAYSVTYLRTLGEIRLCSLGLKIRGNPASLIKSKGEVWRNWNMWVFILLLLFMPCQPSDKTFFMRVFRSEQIKIQYHAIFFCLIGKLKPKCRLCTQGQIITFGECSEVLVAAWPQDRHLVSGY